MTDDQAAQLTEYELLVKINTKLDQLLEKKGKKKGTVIDVEFRERMLDEFGDALGGQMNVDHQIDLACAHESHTKYPGKQMHVKNWLMNAVRFEEERPRKVVQASDGSKYDKDYQRRWGNQ